MKFTLLVDRYASFTLMLYGRSETSEVKLWPEPMKRIDSGVWLAGCIVAYLKLITRCSMIIHSS